ncbi:MAG: glycosyltransferase family 2 protein [Pseudomonadota bacterium]
MNQIASIDVFKAVAPDWARPTLSVVIPMYNEVGNVAFVVDDVAQALGSMPYEIIAVDDGSADGTLAALQDLKDQLPTLRVLHHAENVGQSRAIRSGVQAARGEIIATLDGDGQNPASGIIALYAQFMRDDAPDALGMIGGTRAGRQDKPSRLLASSIARMVRRWVLSDPFVDTGCGLKVFKKQAFLQLPFFDHQHRYLPILMRREGFLVEAHPVQHRPRFSGRSKYTNLGRAAVAIRDVLGVLWLRDRAKQPSAVEEV